MSAAAVDNRCRSDDLRSAGTCDLHRLSRRAAGGDDVFDHEHTIAGLEREPAPQRQRTILPLGEDRPDTQRPADLLPDDDSSESRRNDRLDAASADVIRDGGTAGLRGVRELQYECALQVAGAVKAGGQAEMPFQQGTRAPEERQNIVEVTKG